MNKRKKERHDIKGSIYYRTIIKKKLGNIRVDVASLRQKIAYHKTARKDDWLVFTLFIFFLMDFVFFATLKNWRLPFALIVMQFIAMIVLCIKKGMVKSYEIADRILERIVGESSSNKRDKGAIVAETEADQQDELSKELEAIKSARKQDWFLFIILAFIFLDVVFFSVFRNWADAIALLILEIFAFFVLGQKLNMTDICELISTLLNAIAKKMGGKADS